MTPCAITLKPKLLRTVCVTPVRRVARRFKILLAAPHSVAISAVCTNLERWGISNTYLDNRGSSAQNVWLIHQNDSNKISFLIDTFTVNQGISFVACIQNLYTLIKGQLLAEGFRYENHQPILRPQSASHLLSQSG